MNISLTNNVTLSSSPLNSEKSKKDFAAGLEAAMQALKDLPCPKTIPDIIAVGSLAYIKLSTVAHSAIPELEPMLPFGALRVMLDPLLPINCIDVRNRDGKTLKRFFCE